MKSQFEVSSQTNMIKVSIQTLSKFNGSFSNLAILAFFAAITLQCPLIGTRSAIGQTPEIAEQIDDNFQNETIDASEKPESNSVAEKSVGDESASAPARKLTLTHIVQLSFIAILIIWGYSLVMSGKLGVGWMVLSGILGVLGYFGRMLKSLFQEVTASNEVGDWEDE
jgi:hypothetical protein